MNKLKRSKIYHYDRGPVAILTPTVGDFMEFLSQFPKDMPVMAHWEGQTKGFGDAEVIQGFYIGNICESQPIVLIDTDFDYD